MISALNSAWNSASGNLRGVFWMLGSAFAYTTMATFLRLLADRDYPDSQMVFVRCVAGLVMLAPVMLTRGMSVWHAARPWVLLRRCIYTAIGLFGAFYAFAHMDLAGAQALSFTRSLFIPVLAVWLLHEMVGWRRWSAILIGFLGVVVMLRPGAEALSLAAVAMLISSLATAFTVITIKDLTRDHSVLTQLLWLNLVTTIIGLPFAFAAWETPTALDVAFFIGLGFTGVVAQTCYVRALASGDASFMALIDYARLPLMLLAGLFVFGQIPDGWAMFGAAIVIGSTLYISLREIQIAKAKPPVVEA